MPPKNRPPDATISRNAVRQLANRGLRAPCRINVQTRNGDVTLTGHVMYAHQREAALQAMRTIEGVQRVTDQLKVKPPAKHEYKTLPPRPKPDRAPEATKAEATEASTEEEAAEAETSNATAADATASPNAEAAETSAAVDENLSDSTEFELGPLPLRASFSMHKSPEQTQTDRGEE